MKAEPTELDKRAGALFVVGGGARYWTRFEPSAAGGIWSVFNPDRGYFPHHPTALDTDDPATCGGMLAQVEEVAGAPCMVACGSDIARTGPMAWAVRAWTGRDLNGIASTPFGPTRGAALVAAMEALKP